MNIMFQVIFLKIPPDIIELTNERFISPIGLAIVGGMPGKSELVKQLNPHWCDACHISLNRPLCKEVICTCDQHEKLI